MSVNYFFSSFTSRLRDKVAIQEQFKKDCFRYFTSTLAFGQGARLVCHAHLGTFLLFSFPTLGTLPSMPQACHVRSFLRICAWKRCDTRQELIFCIIFTLADPMFANLRVQGRMKSLAIFPLRDISRANMNLLSGTFTKVVSWEHTVKRKRSPD